MIFWSFYACIWFNNIEKMLLQMTSVSLQPVGTHFTYILHPLTNVTPVGKVV
jgi:hypothetical protein